MTNRSILRAAVLVLVLGMAGCSSVSSTHLALVATTNGVYSYRINNSSGAPATVLSAPFILGRSPSAIVITPSGDRAYVANQRDNTISLVKINAAAGSLSEILPRTTTVGIAPSAMVIDEAGTFLYVAEQDSNSVESYSIASDGSLKLVSSASVGSSPSNLALSRSGDMLFVAVPNFSAIYVFTLSSGALTPVSGSPFTVQNGLATVAVDPAADFLYAPNPTADTISGFSILPGGVLSELSTSPYGNTSAALKTPVAAAVDPSGQYLYVANSASATISEFKVSSTGELTAVTGTSASAGTNPQFITFDPDGQFMYVANQGSNSITELLLNSDGTLTSKNTIQVGAVPRGLALTH